MLQLQLLFKSNKITNLLHSLLSCQVHCKFLHFHGNKISMTILQNFNSFIILQSNEEVLQTSTEIR